jgi:hypothetical protein
MSSQKIARITLANTSDNFSTAFPRGLAIALKQLPKPTVGQAFLPATVERTRSTVP